MDQDRRARIEAIDRDLKADLVRVVKLPAGFRERRVDEGFSGGCFADRYTFVRSLPVTMLKRPGYRLGIEAAFEKHGLTVF